MPYKYLVSSFSRCCCANKLIELAQRTYKKRKREIPFAFRYRFNDKLFFFQSSRTRTTEQMKSFIANNGKLNFSKLSIVYSISKGFIHGLNHNRFIFQLNVPFKIHVPLKNFFDVVTKQYHEYLYENS